MKLKCDESPSKFAFKFKLHHYTKVQLNLGILARRRRQYDAADSHFERAQAIEPGFCEPTYWKALTALNQGRMQAGMDGLRAGAYTRLLLGPT